MVPANQLLFFRVADLLWHTNRANYRVDGENFNDLKPVVTEGGIAGLWPFNKRWSGISRRSWMTEHDYEGGLPAALKLADDKTAERSWPVSLQSERKLLSVATVWRWWIRHLFIWWAMIMWLESRRKLTAIFHDWLFRVQIVTNMTCIVGSAPSLGSYVRTPERFWLPAVQECFARTNLSAVGLLPPRIEHSESLGDSEHIYRLMIIANRGVWKVLCGFSGWKD